jgi:mannose-6-phosphate isomerase-like protein (cupin superfamily)
MNVSAILDSDTAKQNEMSKKYGVEYFLRGQQAVTGARETDLYPYTTYIGQHSIAVEKGDCAYTYDDKGFAHVQTGPLKLESKIITTVIRGYTPPSRSVQVGRSTHLPYVNGCSTRQIFTPERIGDPTLQLLHMPPHASEQVHHIHSTARIVHILEGRGRCVVGMDKWVGKQDLLPGMSLVLHPMCPHHFETDDESLLVLPLHIFSSPPAGIEYNHPMFNGTHKIS